MLLSDILYCVIGLSLCFIIIFGYFPLVKAIWKTTHETIICYSNDRCLTCSLVRRKYCCPRNKPASFSDVAGEVAVLIALILLPIAFILDLLDL